MKNHLIYPPAMALAFAGLCCTALQAEAGEVAVEQCPQTLNVQHILKSPVGNEWKTVIREDPLPLEIIGISWGEFPVEQTGFEAPEERKILPNMDVIAYYYTEGAGGMHQTKTGKMVDEHYWAVCRYVGAIVYLTKIIPKTAKRCEVKYYASPHLPGKDRATIKCFDTHRKTK
jgi:hypothetical protein